MFSSGQINFALFFIVVFIVAMVWSYKKDTHLHKLYYKNSYVVLVAMFVVMILFGSIVMSLHK